MDWRIFNCLASCTNAEQMVCAGSASTPAVLMHGLAKSVRYCKQRNYPALHFAVGLMCCPSW